MSNTESSNSNNKRNEMLDQVNYGLIITFMFVLLIVIAGLFVYSFVISLKNAQRIAHDKSDIAVYDKDVIAPQKSATTVDSEADELEDSDNDEAEDVEDDELTIREQILDFYNKNKCMTEDYLTFEEDYLDYMSNVNMLEEDLMSMYDDEQIERIITEIELHKEEIKDFESKSVDEQVKMNLLYAIALECENEVSKSNEVLQNSELFIDELSDIDLKQYLLIELGKMYTEQYDFENAKLQYDKLIELNGDSYLGYYFRAKIHYYTNNIEASIADFKTQLELEEQQNDINLNQYEEACILSANMYKLQHKTAKAIELVKKSLEYFDDKIENLVFLAKLYMFIENYDAAKDYLNDAEFIDPENSDLILAKCQYLREFEKEYEDALIMINDLLYIAPEDYMAYNERGKIYTNLRLYDTAFNDFNRALKLAPMFANAYGNRGWLYFKYYNNRDRALADYNNAILLDTNLEYVYNNRGVLLMESFKNNSKAIEDFTQALKIKPRYYLALVNRGIAKLRSNEIKDAIEDFQNAKKIDDENYIVYFQLGKSYLKLKEFDKAIKNLTLAIEKNDKIWEPYFERALAYIAINKIESALSDMKSALQIEPSLGEDKVFKETMTKCNKSN